MEAGDRARGKEGKRGREEEGKRARGREGKREREHARARAQARARGDDSGTIEVVARDRDGRDHIHQALLELFEIQAPRIVDVELLIDVV